MKTGAPVIGLIDSAGLRLQEGADALNAFGEIYSKQVTASGMIPQITNNNYLTGTKIPHVAYSISIT